MLPCYSCVCCQLSKPSIYQNSKYVSVSLCACSHPLNKNANHKYFQDEVKTDVTISSTQDPLSMHIYTDMKDRRNTPLVWEAAE